MVPRFLAPSLDKVLRRCFFSTKFMTTEISLEGKKIDDWLLKKGDADYSGFIQATVAVLPDEPGVYETVFGKIGIAYSSVVNGGVDKSPIVVLDCSQISILQSRGARLKRIINLNGKGLGSQQLRDGVDLVITTKADLKEFRGKRK